MNREAVVALVSDPDVSHTAWRITRPYRRLREAGVDAQVLRFGPPGTDGLTWNPQLAGIAFEDSVGVIALPRVTVPPLYRLEFLAWVERMRGQGRRVVYETDDDIFSDAWAEHHLACWIDRHVVTAPEAARDQFLDHYRRQSEEDRWILQHVDAVTVSTEHLAGVIRQHTHIPVHVIPNAIDVEAFCAGLSARPAWADVVTIGWSAGYRPEADAEPVAEAWRRIAERYPEACFVVAGWPPCCLVRAVPADRLVRVPYADMAGYPAGMQVDIGCVSAADTAFNRSRSPGKAWEYGLAGAAVVGSGPVYGDELPGRGYVAATVDDWGRTLAYLLDLPGARRWLSSKMARYVDRERSLTASLHRWSDAYRAIRQGWAPAQIAPPPRGTHDLALQGAFDG